MATKLSDSERGRLESALAAICRKAGLDPSSAALMRFTMNAVYRLDTEGVVVRMNNGPNAVALTTKVAQAATAFARLGLPTVRLVPRITQPVHAQGWSATIWTLLPQPPGHRFEPVDIAGPLRELHAFPSLPVELPTWDPVEVSRRRLAQSDALSGPGRRYLQEWAADQVGLSLDKISDWLWRHCEETAAALATATWSRPWSVIHGDAHAGNLLRGQDGGVVICDLDSVAIGPPEWDLVPAAHGALRFGDSADKNAAFAKAYGLDVTCCPAWETLRRARELQLLTSVMANLPGRPDVANELANRLRTGLAGDRSARWHRYQ